MQKSRPESNEKSQADIGKEKSKNSQPDGALIGWAIFPLERIEISKLLH